MKKIKIGDPLRKGHKGKNYTNNYFNHTFSFQKNWISSLSRYIGLTKESEVISLGSGFCAEEILLAKYCKKVYCVDPSIESLKIGKSFSNKLQVNNLEFLYEGTETFKSNKRFNLIYTSAPSDWMHSSPTLFIPDEYIKFINKYSKKDSYVCFILYGGFFNRKILFNRYFISSLKTKLSNKTNFRVIDVNYSKNKKGSGIIMILCSNSNLDNFSKRHKGKIVSLQRKEYKTWDKMLFWIEILIQRLRKIKNEKRKK